MNDKPILFPAKLVVITTNYPSTANPAYGTFVRQFAHAVARQGVKCIVVHPVPVHDAMQSKGLPFHDEEDAGSGNYVKVYRPRFFSLSARESFVGLGPLNPSLFTLNQFTRSVRRVLRSQKIEPDALYGHFLFLSGAAAVRLGAEMGIPAFPCIGESGLWTVRVFGVNRAIKELASASGFLANSTLLKEILHNDLFIASDHIGVFPNGTDLKLFKPQDKWTARKRFGLPHNCFLVASVGNFSMRKGIARIGEAIEGLQGVAGVFAGAGNEPPRVGNIVFCRQLAHRDIPELLSACDVFVLPTTMEGSCNALVEAMACGLPIISSVGAFNDDILNDSVSIRIDPLNVKAIREAIITLRDNPLLREKMSQSALMHSLNFDSNERAKRMLTFMGEKISNQL